MKILRVIGLAAAAGVFLQAFSGGATYAQSVKKYSVFKNGKAFVFTLDSVRADNGKSILQVPSEALLGTLWIGATTSPIISITSEPAKLNTKRNFETIREMLSYNIGKKVRLILAYQEPVEATLTSVVNDFAIFKTKDRWISTSIDKIETIEFLEEPVTQTQQDGRQLEITWLNRIPAKHFVSTVYMRDGLTWVPEYFIIVQDGKENATFSLRANLVNDAENLNHAEVNFAVGAPNFAQTDKYEPLSSSQSINELFGTDATQLNFNMVSNSAYVPYNGTAKNASGNTQNMFSAEGETVQDMFVYTVKGVDLVKGGRSAYPLLETTVPLRHLYKVDLNDGINYMSSVIPSPQQRNNTVFHYLELTNETEQPWTTGTAFVVREGNGQTQPLGQDILKYAAKGEKTLVKLSAAPDVIVLDKEQEINRDADVVRKEGSTMDVVTIEGTITVRNKKDKEINLSLSRGFYGEAVKSDVAWKIVKEADVVSAYNTKNTANWELVLKPGEQRTITYKYKVQVIK